MTLYILNTLIIPIKDDVALFEIKRIDVEEAKKILQSRQSFTSAIGHEATAQLMSMLLGLKIPTNRIAIYFSQGDEAIAFMLNKRLNEGQIIKSVEELQQIGFTLYYIRRVE